MDREQKLDLMWKRFVHDRASYAIQYYNEEQDRTQYFRVTKGSCNHRPKHVKLKDCPSVHDVMFKPKHLADHLMGKMTVAPYQTSREGTVKWLCLDIDAYEGSDETEIRACVKAIARNSNRLLGKGHVLVENSGSKGYHLWWFFDGPCEVGYAHSLGNQLAANVQIPHNTHLEVYPKHSVHQPNFFGATVKLPLGVHRKTLKRCFFVNSDFEKYEDQWEILDKVNTVRVKWVYDHVKVVSVAPPKEHMQPNIWTPLCLTELMERGADEGMRDEVAFKISCYFRSKGLPEDMAYVALTHWNRLNHPPMDEPDIQTKVTQAYSSSYVFLPCSDHRFDKHCHSTCSFFNKKVEKRWFVEKESPIGNISRD